MLCIRRNNIKKLRIGEVRPWFDFVTPLMAFLWVGNFDGNRMISRTDRRVITITGKDFTGTIIPSNSTATLSLPADADFIAADLPDNCWFNSLGIPVQRSISDLFTYTYKRTLVYCPNQAPYNEFAIGILKATAVLTDDQRNALAQAFQLPLFWSEI